MQAKLEPSEFAYLLNVLDARKIVGVDNDLLFPAEPAQKEALLTEGFEQLVEHGWFQKEDGQINANNTLFLMTAVTAQPEIVITVTYIDSQKLEHTVTYYLADRFIVEQFPDQEGDFLLTMIDDETQILTHIHQAFAPPTLSQQMQIELPLEGFSFGLAAARQDDLRPLQQLITQNPSLAKMAEPLARALGSLQPAGQIEGAAVPGGRLVHWQEIGLLRDSSNQLWSAVQDDEAETITLAQISADPFKLQLEGFIATLKKAATN